MIRSEQLDLDNVFELLVPRNEYTKTTILKILGKLTEQQLYDLGLAVISRSDILNKLALLDDNEQALMFGEGGIKKLIIDSMSGMTKDQFESTGLDNYLTSDKLIELLGLLDEADLEKLGIENETRGSIIEKLNNLTENEKTSLGINYTSKFNTYNNRLDTLETNVSDLQTSTNSLSSRLNTAENSITNLNNKVDTNTTAITEVNNKVDADIASKNTAISNINKSIETINTNISGLTSNVENNSNNISTNTSNITSITSSLNTQIDKINNLNTNMTNSLNRLEALEQTVSGISIVTINETLLRSNWAEYTSDTSKNVYRYSNSDITSSTVVTVNFNPADVVGQTIAGIEDKVESFDGYIELYCPANNIPTVDIPVSISFKKD